MWIRRRHFRQRDLLEVKYSWRVTVVVLLQFNLFFYNLKKKSTIIVTCFPVVKNLPANAGDARDTGSGRFPWRRKWQPNPVFLPGKFHGQRSLAGYNPWGCKDSNRNEQLSTRRAKKTEAGLSLLQLLPFCQNLSMPHFFWLTNATNRTCSLIFQLLKILDQQMSTTCEFLC